MRRRTDDAPRVSACETPATRRTLPLTLLGIALALGGAGCGAPCSPKPAPASPSTVESPNGDRSSSPTVRFPGSNPARPDAFSSDATVGATTLSLHGSGLCEFGLFAIDVYWAALYTRGSERREAAELIDSDEPKLLRMNFVRSLSKEQLGRAWEAAVDANARYRSDSTEASLRALQSLMHPVSSGESLVFWIDPLFGIHVYAGGTEVDHCGFVPSGDFARLFLRLFLGESPPDPNLRRGLLGE